MRTNLRAAVTAAAVLTLVALSALPATADTVMDVANRPYEGTILRIDEKGLVLRWSMTRSEKAFPLNEVKLIKVDDQDDLNSAEELRTSGQYKDAVASYERAKLRARKAWVREYINARLVEAFDKTGQFARAVKMYVELCESKSTLVQWTALPEVPSEGGADVSEALRAVEGALKRDDIAGKNRLEELRLNVKMAQGDPTEVLAEIEKQLESPNPEHRSKMRLKHIELLIQVDQLDKAASSLQVAREGRGDAMPALDPVYEPNLLYLQGRYEESRGDPLHAALAYMRVAINFPRKQDLAAESLLRAAEAMMASQQVPLREVAAPLRELMQKYPESSAAVKAEAMMNRLQSGS